MKKFLLPLLLLSVYFVSFADDDVTFSPELLQQAEYGDVEAQCELGDCYYYGNGVSKDLEKAFMWFSKAAEQGSDFAQCALGFMYENGELVSKNIEKAIEWYNLAAEQGNPDAQYLLAELYFDGEEVQEDLAKAVNLYRKAAAQGHEDAQFSLGWCYKEGLGVEKNLTKAKEWFQKAANEGHEDAADELDKINETIKTEKADAAALNTFMKNMVGHTYSCKNVTFGGDGDVIMAVGGIVISQTVSFTSSKKAVLKTHVALNTQAARTSQLGIALKSRLEAISGTMTIDTLEGYIVLIDSQGEKRAAFKPHGTSKLTDPYNNVFNKVK